MGQNISAPSSATATTARPPPAMTGPLLSLPAEIREMILIELNLSSRPRLIRRAANLNFKIMPHFANLQPGMRANSALWHEYCTAVIKSQTPQSHCTLSNIPEVVKKMGIRSCLPAPKSKCTDGVYHVDFLCRVVQRDLRTLWLPYARPSHVLDHQVDAYSFRDSALDAFAAHFSALTEVTTLIIEISTQSVEENVIVHQRSSDRLAQCLVSRTTKVLLNLPNLLEFSVRGNKKFGTWAKRDSAENGWFIGPHRLAAAAPVGVHGLNCFDPLQEWWEATPWLGNGEEEWRMLLEGAGLLEAEEKY